MHMKLNITVFLLKEGLSRGDAISTDRALTHQQIIIDDIESDFYWAKNRSRPPWVSLIEQCNQIDTSEMYGHSLQGALVLERHGRVFCVTFGHARHLLNQNTIERYFGLKVALSLSDPGLLKSIDKSNIDRVPLRSRAQSSKYLSISEFEFKFDWECSGQVILATVL